jgi:hypothetical protein
VALEPDHYIPENLFNFPLNIFLKRKSTNRYLRNIFTRYFLETSSFFSRMVEKRLCINKYQSLRTDPDPNYPDPDLVMKVPNRDPAKSFRTRPDPDPEHGGGEKLLLYIASLK